MVFLYIWLFHCVEEEHEPEIETLRAGTTSPFGSLANAAREADLERLKPGDENRLFYKLPVYKRMIIMLGGPSMNLLIGIVCTAILICGFGTLSATNKVASVSDCVPKATITEDRISYSECTDSSAPSPAKAAGLRKDDRIVAINGNRTSTWEQVSSNIRQAGNNTVTVTIERDGSEQQLTMTPALLERLVVDEKTREYVRNDDGSFKMMTGGFIGISPTSEMVPGSLGDVMPNVGDTLGRIAHSMWSLPQRVWELGVNLFSNQERDANSPVSVVGVSRIAGEVASTDRIDLKAKTATLVSLIAGMNLMLFAFNLLPLLPLDGGHVFGTLLPGLIIDEQRHNDHDRIGPRNRLRVVTGGTQPPSRHQPRQFLLQMSLTRERLNTGIDRIHHGLLNINTHNLMPHVSKLDNQQQNLNCVFLEISVK